MPGCYPYRELDDAVGLTDIGGDVLADARTAKNGRHRLVGLLRQSVFGRLAGYEDVNDADRLCRDPAIRWVVDDRAITGSAASASQMDRFETEWLTRPEKLTALADLPCRWIDKVHQRRPPRIVVLDIDSSESRPMASRKAAPTTATLAAPVITRCSCSTNSAMWSGALYGRATCCADGWRAVLESVIARYRGTEKRRYFRGDAAFASPEIYEFLKTEGMGYAIRLPANRVLQDRIGYLLRRPVERPPHEVRRFYASFRYQAQSWNKPRRVVAKVEWDPGELYPRVGFIVTNLARRAERIVAFYNQRGTAEQWKEGKGAIKWTRLSCRTFAANAVRLQLHAPRLQSRQFHANAGDARDRRAVVADQLAREADQDRRQGGQSRPLRPSSWPRSRCRGRCLRTFCRRSPGCERLPRQHEERWVKVQHTTTAEVCLDECRAARFRASVQSTGGVASLLRTRCAMYRCPRRPKGRSWLTIHHGIRGMSV
jgi:hypothetical protein